MLWSWKPQWLRRAWAGELHASSLHPVPGSDPAAWSLIEILMWRTEQRQRTEYQNHMPNPHPPRPHPNLPLHKLGREVKMQDKMEILNKRNVPKDYLLLGYWTNSFVSRRTKSEGRGREREAVWCGGSNSTQHHIDCPWI